MAAEAVEYVRAKLARVCAALYDGFERGAKQVDDRVGADLPGPDYDWARTHLTRAYTHRNLRAGHLGGWELTGNHQRNGELWLRDGMTRLRLLHTNSATTIPPAGTDRSRWAHYRNVPLLHLPEQLVLDLAEQSQLLGLWRVIDPIRHEVGIRVVRPTTPGRRFAGAVAEVDIDFMLPRSAEELLSLEFTPADDLTIELPEDAGEVTAERDEQADDGSRG